MAKKALTFVDGQWLEGNPPLVGPMSHCLWLSSVVFDGARVFEGVAPDLMRHSERAVRSALALGLAPIRSAGEIHALALEGIGRFPSDAALYVRPMFFAESGFVDPDPDSTRFCLSVYESAMPEARGYSACLSTRRRPHRETAPTEAKAAALYPQSGLALREAKQRGFENAVMLDPLGSIAEFATANIFLVRDGVVFTPTPNGTFLNGITRQRVIGLLRDDGVEVREEMLTPADLLAADEVFSSGNYAKLQAFSRVEDRDLQPGPIYARARRLYWDYAHS